MRIDRALELVNNFDKQILVIGDVMLDKFVYGYVHRFSPEFPSCVVLDHFQEDLMLGGAGNSAANLIALGAKCVRLCGLVGYDTEGQKLRWMLQNEYSGIDDQLQKTKRPTTVKTRFVSQDGNHLLRYDKEDITPSNGLEQKLMLEKVKDMIRIVSAVIVEDYDKGSITRDSIRSIMNMANLKGIPVFVDPKSSHWEHFRGAEVITPNVAEAYGALGRKPPREGEISVEYSVEEVGKTLLKYTRANAVIITRGKDGMSLFDGDGSRAWALPEPTTVVDVSGAGDTAMAALTLARVAGASWLESMELANIAAGISVSKRGTATVNVEELLLKIRRNENE